MGVKCNKTSGQKKKILITVIMCITKYTQKKKRKKKRYQNDLDKFVPALCDDDGKYKIKYWSDNILTLRSHHIR